ncbi:MAG: hypothetical protein AAF289_22365, partial [Cyanobacteria bacterium P01_A01_bin.135]
MFLNRHPQLLAAITAIGVLLLSPAHNGSKGVSTPLASHLTRPQPAAASPTAIAPTPSVPMQVLDRHGRSATEVVDGNRVRLRIQLANRSVRSQIVRFAIAENDAIATCAIPAGRRRCTTAPLSTRGWRWLNREPQLQRQIDAFVQDVP